MKQTFQGENIYIAGPECFYEGGPALLATMKQHSEAQGFGVTLPNDHPLDMENPDLRKRADSIFADLEAVMRETTVVIADLEAFRGSEADSGTIYELGMAYAKGARCFGYTRDKRPLSWKDQKYQFDGKHITDEHGKIAPYPDLPFAPSVVASTKITEGDYQHCLSRLMEELEEEKKLGGTERQAGTDAAECSADNKACSADAADCGMEDRSCVSGCADRRTEKPDGWRQTPLHARPRIFLSGTERYEKNARELYARYKALGEQLGVEILTPMDGILPQLENCTAEAFRAARNSGNLENGGMSGAERKNIDAEKIPEAFTEDPYARAAYLFQNWQQQLAACDAILADLNDYRGYECSNDVGFECGAAFQMGKKCFGYMRDTRRMRDRFPNRGEKYGFRDMNGANVENFDYPINLMIGSSMQIYEGSIEEILPKVAEALGGEKCRR